MATFTLVPTFLGTPKKIAAWLCLLALILSLLAPVKASPVPMDKRQQIAPTQILPDNVTQIADGYQLTVHLAVLGIILIIVGLVYTFLGYRFFGLTMFLSGFFFFGDIAWILLENVDPSNGYGPYRDTIFLVVSIGTGIIGGLIVVCCYHLGIYFLAAMGGYSLGLWFLSWADNGVVQQTWGRVVLLMGLAIIAIVLVIFFERPLIIALTAFVGSLSLFIGLDVFIHTGFISTILQFIDRNQTAVTLTYRVYAMLAGVAALAIVGAVVQFLVHPGQDKWARTYAPPKKEEGDAEKEHSHSNLPGSAGRWAKWFGVTF